MIDRNELLRKFSGTNLKRIESNLKRIPFKFFLPSGSQAEFIRSIGILAPMKRIFLATSGNGAGKTTMIINIIVNIIWRNVNIWRQIIDIDNQDRYVYWRGFFNWPFYRNYPAGWPKRIWYISNRDSIEAIWEEMKSWIPDYLYTKSNKGKQFISHIEYIGTDWVLNFKTTDQDLETFESANLGIIICDEPPPRSIFKALVSRLRKGGIMIIVGTPLFGAGYFVDEIINKVKPSNYYYHQTVSVWSNSVERGGRWYIRGFGIHPKGNLLERDIQFTLDNYDPEELPARESGKFMYLSGVIYKTYSSSIHLIDKTETKKGAHEYVWQFVLDPHDRRPPAAIWVQIDEWNRRHIVREWPCPILDDVYNGQMYHLIKHHDPYTLKDFVAFFIDIFKTLKVPISRLEAIIDPNSGRREDSLTGLMTYQKYEEEFARQNYPITFRTDIRDDLSVGHKEIKQCLVSGINGPALTIDPRCVNVDYGMRNYSWDEYRGKHAEYQGIKEKVRDRAKDFPDLLRYSVMSQKVWEPVEYSELVDEETDYRYKDERERIPEGPDYI